MIIATFSHNILGYSDAAQLQRRSTDAVTELVLRCLCLLTQPAGMASKSTTAAKYINDTLGDGVPWGIENDICRQNSLSLWFDWYQFWPTLVPAGQYL